MVKTLASGEVDIKEIESLVNEYGSKIALISIMAANNETGVVQPFKEIAKLSSDNGILYFSDTTQFIGSKSEVLSTFRTFSLTTISSTVGYWSWGSTTIVQIINN